jgi:conjugative relaxase-like TrwC/TraI family protein
MVATVRTVSGFVERLVRYFVIFYYAAQSAGRWFGKAAEFLGWRGDVTREDLEAGLCGRSATGKQLVKPFRASDDHDSETCASANGKTNAKTAKRKRKNALGVDLQFAVPKSLSVLWALRPALRPTIERILRETVCDVLAWVEQTLPLARRGKCGMTRIQADLVAAIFIHLINRAEEPHLHAHSLIMSMVRGCDRKWSKLFTRLLFAWTPTLGRIFRATLAHKLQSELGLELVRPVDSRGREQSWFELNGIPQALIDANSSRRKEVVEAAGPLGRFTGPEAARLRQQAAFDTRADKEPMVDLAQVFDRCERQARELGVNPEALDRLLGRSRPLLPEKRKRLYEEAFQHALDKVTREKAHFRERDVVSAVVERLQHHGFIGTDLADRVMADVPRRPELLPLREYQGEKQFTTTAMWKLEERLFADVDALRRRKGALLTFAQTEAVIRKHRSLSIEQKKAVRRLLSRKRAIRVLTGVAGAGKTMALEALRSGFEQAGYRVIGGALAGIVARELEHKTGIKSRTIASHLHRLDKPLSKRLRDALRHHLRMLVRELLGKKTWKHERPKLDLKSVLIIDEASMLSTQDVARLVRLVRKARATIILCGDVKQLPAIGAGAPLAKLAKELPRAELNVNQRQIDPEDREAAAALRNGEVRKALQNYLDRGRLVIAEDHADMVSRLVSCWREAGGAARPQDHMILTQTRADARGINRLCQEERLAAQGTPPGRCLKADDDRFYVNDRVLFCQRMLGVENGEFGRVTHIELVRRRLTIRLERERTAEERAKGFGRDVNISVPRTDNELLALAYAATTHKLQGATVNHVYALLGGPMTSQEMAYVQTTRGRVTSHLFVDRQLAGPGLVDLERSLRRSLAKPLAHDLGQSR